MPAKTREQIKHRRSEIVRGSMKYGALTVCGVLLFRLTAAYALAKRGYYAVGGEALALLLPVLYYVAAVMIRDIIKDGGEDI